MADMSSNGLMDKVLEEEGGGEAKKELEIWKTKAERADDVKARLILEKLEEDEVKATAQQDMMACVRKQEECQRDFTHSMDTVQDEILKLDNHRQDLLDKLKRCKIELETKRVESTKLKQKLKIYALIPETETAFTARDEEEREDDSQPIRGVFAISQRPSMILQGGQVLITFEEETVASQILKIAKFSVSGEDIILEVKPKRITLDPAVKFEVHLDVSRKELQVANIPLSMPEERMKDRLELSFSRPSRGGGEVDQVEYDRTTGTGRITFLKPGVADSLVLRGRYHVDLDSEVNVQVGAIYKYQLCKFQTFCGSPKRTVLLDDIEDKKDEGYLQDDLEIYFQKSSNYGGEIEYIKYISRGKTLQTFFSEDSL